MKFQLKPYDVIPLLMSALILIWFALPSSLFLKPISWQIDGKEVTFTRLTPFGDVTAHWTAEITLINGEGFECSGEGTGFYQLEPGNTTKRRIGFWAQDCINAGPPFTIRMTWQVMLFDFIPLRKVESILVVDGTRSDRQAMPAIVN